MAAGKIGLEALKEFAGKVRGEVKLEFGREDRRLAWDIETLRRGSGRAAVAEPVSELFELSTQKRPAGTGVAEVGA
jgi:hypothetical protein